jgi:hypothetical protein
VLAAFLFLPLFLTLFSGASAGCALLLCRFLRITRRSTYFSLRRPRRSAPRQLGENPSDCHTLSNAPTKVSRRSAHPELCRTTSVTEVPPVRQQTTFIPGTQPFLARTLLFRIEAVWGFSTLTQLF